MFRSGTHTTVPGTNTAAGPQAGAGSAPHGHGDAVTDGEQCRDELLGLPEDPGDLPHDDGVGVTLGGIGELAKDALEQRKGA